jgi:hypothetical protein
MPQLMSGRDGDPDIAKWALDQALHGRPGVDAATQRALLQHALDLTDRLLNPAGDHGDALASIMRAVGGPASVRRLRLQVVCKCRMCPTGALCCLRSCHDSATHSKNDHYDKAHSAALVPLL